MKYLWFSLLVCVGCTLRPPAQLYNPQNEKAAIESWSDAYNRADVQALRQLVHPLKKGQYDLEKARISHQLKTWRFKSYLIGEQVRINERLLGRKVIMNYHDGQLELPREQLVVSSEGRWWFWSF
tara:strand:- start:18 stop:392 length:375 start_codon:yes stop_codon:yes gene_type:complete